jgi:hypothetical protein
MPVSCSTRQVGARVLGIPGPRGHGVPTGGAPESILTKASDVDNDTYWGLNPSASDIIWTITDTSYGASNKENIVADTSSGILSIILPVSPVPGWNVRIKTTLAYINNLTITRNGSLILGDAEDYIIDGNFLDITFVYVNSTIGWIT